MHIKLLGIISVDLMQLASSHQISHIHYILEKNESPMGQNVSYS